MILTDFFKKKKGKRENRKGKGKLYCIILLFLRGMHLTSENLKSEAFFIVFFVFETGPLCVLLAFLELVVHPVKKPLAQLFRDQGEGFVS